MSLAHSPQIVTNGLVFYYDMGNTQKSWKGRPVTNQFAIPTPDSNGYVGFSVNGNGTFRRIYTGTYGGYTIGPNDIVYRYDLGNAGCHYHGNDVSISSGQTATWSCDYYIDPTTTGYPQTNHLANFEGVVSGSSYDPSPSVIGIWKKFTFSSTANSTGLCRMLLYPGGCGDRLATGGFILFKNPQVEFDAPGGIPTPFIAGTRTNTQAILDLTNNNTITATSLTYNSDGSFSFNGSSDYMSIGNSSNFYFAGDFAVDGWLKRGGSSGSAWELGYYYNGILFRPWESDDLYINGSNYGNISQYFTLNTWCHFCITRIGTNVTLYSNGVSVWSATISGTINSSSEGMYLGKSRHTSGQYYTGSLSNIKVYKDKGLSAAEVKQNFNALRGRFGI